MDLDEIVADIPEAIKKRRLNGISGGLRLYLIPEAGHDKLKYFLHQLVW